MSCHGNHNDCGQHSSGKEVGVHDKNNMQWPSVKIWPTSGTAIHYYMIIQWQYAHFSGLRGPDEAFDINISQYQK